MRLLTFELYNTGTSILGGVTSTLSYEHSIMTFAVWNSAGLPETNTLWHSVESLKGHPVESSGSCIRQI